MKMIKNATLLGLSLVCSPLMAHTGSHHSEGVLPALAHVAGSADHWLVFSALALLAFGVHQRSRLRQALLSLLKRVQRNSDV